MESGRWQLWPCVPGNLFQSLIIHEIKTKEINNETEFGYVRKNLHKLTQLSSQFSPKICICFSCNMTLRRVFITYPNTSKCVKKSRVRLVFSAHFSMFGYVMKHPSSCFIYFITTRIIQIIYLSYKTICNSN